MISPAATVTPTTASNWIKKRVPIHLMVLRKTFQNLIPLKNTNFYFFNQKADENKEFWLELDFLSYTYFIRI